MEVCEEESTVTHTFGSLHIIRYEMDVCHSHVSQDLATVPDENKEVLIYSESMTMTSAECSVKGAETSAENNKSSSFAQRDGIDVFLSIASHI